MSDKVYRLPSGEETQDTALFCDQWREFASPLESGLDRTISYVTNQIIVLHDGQWRHRDSLSFPTARRLVALLAERAACPHCGRVLAAEMEESDA